MRLFITGATGFIGSALSKRLAELGHEVLAHGRNIAKLQTLERYNQNIRPIYYDQHSITFNIELGNADYVCHIAAQKYLNVGEKSPMNTIRANIEFTEHVLRQSEHAGGFLFMSTDKSAEPCNVYGYTKLLAEKLVWELAELNTKCRYSVVRSGNVFGSTGSVIPIWKERAAKGLPLEVSALDATRFFIDVDTLVDLLVDVVETRKTGTITPYMNAASLASLMLLFPGAAYRERGLGPGEKKHETLSGVNSNEVEQLDYGTLKAWFDNLEDQHGT